MGFRINATLYDHEFRGMQTGAKKDGTGQWMTLVFETPNEEATQVQINVPTEKQGEVFNKGLVRGQKYHMDVIAAAGNTRTGSSYSYLQLVRFFDEESEDAMLSSAVSSALDY